MGTETFDSIRLLEDTVLAESTKSTYLMLFLKKSFFELLEDLF